MLQLFEAEKKTNSRWYYFTTYIIHWNKGYGGPRKQSSHVRCLLIWPGTWFSPGQNYIQSNWVQAGSNSITGGLTVGVRVNMSDSQQDRSGLSISSDHVVHHNHGRLKKKRYGFWSETAVMRSIQVDHILDWVQLSLGLFWIWSGCPQVPFRLFISINIHLIESIWVLVGFSWACSRLSTLQDFWDIKISN